LTRSAQLEQRSAREVARPAQPKECSAREVARLEQLKQWPAREVAQIVAAHAPFVAFRLQLVIHTYGQYKESVEF
jgi:hypothetical protein